MSLEILAWLLPTFFIAGWVDAIAGGGGLITVPALLTMGIAPHTVLGTNKLIGTFGTSTAAWVCIRKGIFRPQFWYLMSGATLGGACLGTLLAGWVSSEWLQKFLPLIILGAAIYIFFHRPTQQDSQSIIIVQNNYKSGILGTVLGFYDGFIGPGTGAFWTTATMALYRVDIVTASGIARFMNFISNIVSLATFSYLQHVDFILGIGLGITLMLGAYLGVHSALRFGAPLIRPLFILVVLATATRLAWQAWL